MNQREPFVRAPHWQYEIAPLLPGKTEMLMLLALVRETYGWHRNEVTVSLGDWEQLTGCTRPAVVAALDYLLNQLKLFARREVKGAYVYTFCDPEGALARLQAGEVKKANSYDKRARKRGAPAESDQPTDGGLNGLTSSTVEPEAVKQFNHDKEERNREKETHHPPTPQEATPPAAPARSEPRRGGGGSASPGRNRTPEPAHPDTIAYLQKLPSGESVSMAADCGDVPLEVAQAMYRTAKRSNVKSIPGTIYGYVKAWREGRWQPPAAPAAPAVVRAPEPEQVPVLSVEERRALLAAWRAGGRA